MKICPSCGEENPDRFRLCGICGAELGAQAPAQETRKVITVVFCDLKGSTTLGEHLDPESLREVLAHYFARMQSILERHGGRVEKYIGDAIVAVFGLPRAHEDDALRAVRAAAEMRKALAAMNEELDARWGVRLANRTGVNTGEVVAGDVTRGQRLVTGDTMNVAARLEQAAPENDVLIGEATYRLVREVVRADPLEPLDLKGKAEPVPAYRLLEVTEGEAIPRRLEAPMVGRERELALLTDRFRTAVAERACHLVTVVGPAGAGKSRLIQELVGSVAAEATTLRGRCQSYGEGITFLPLAEVVRQAVGVGPDAGSDEVRARIEALCEAEGERVAERVVAGMGLLPEAYPVEETFWAARKLLESLARRRPLVVVIDDIHWAEPTLLDLIEHVLDAARDAPILLLCSSRHELLEDRPGWGEGRADATTLVLTPLSDADSARIVENSLGSALPPDLGDRIVRAAGGNPLFVEQMVSMLVDEGLVERADGGWRVTGDLESFSVPPTIFALLTARLDRLGPEERAVAERGSVVGHVFYRGAVAALCPEPIRPLVPAQLASLGRKQLIRPDQSDLAGEEAFRFHHVLIRDAAYQGLLKRARIELHEVFAEWLEGAAASLIEFEEVVGYHLERAYRYREELGPIDEAGRQVAGRAARRLAAAGKRAFARGDMPAAANLLERASALLAPDDPVRLALAPDLGEALKDLGELEAAGRRLEEAVRLARAAGDPRLEMDARVVRLLVRSAEGVERVEDVLQEAEEAIPVLEEAGDEAALARAWRLVGLVLGTVGRYGEAERAVLRGREHARRAGHRRQEARNVALYAAFAVYGPTPVPEAVARCEQLLAEAAGDHRGEALVRLALSQLRAMRGEFEAARELYRQSRAILLDLGERALAATTASDSGRVEMLAGDLAAAEAELRRDYEALDAMGEKYSLSTIAALLAHALYLLGRDREAEALTGVAEAGDQEDVETQSLWRRARAKALARRGEVEEAERLATAALDLISGVESPVLEAGTRMDLAEVLRAAGRPGKAARQVRAALALFEAKGSLVGAERARAALSALVSEAGAP